MSLHDDIQQTLRRAIETADASGALELSPTTLANLAYGEYGRANDDVHVRYGCVEHFKQMARAILADRYEPDGDDSEAYQGDMFSGHLQARYPIPRARNAEPIYKPREALSNEELDWNIEQLRKSAAARVKHADALQLYRDSRAPGMSA